jgi:hypothetical protein
MTVEEDLIRPIANKYHIDEFLSMYTSKVDVKHWVRAKAELLGAHGLPVHHTKEILREFSRALIIIGKKDQPKFDQAIKEMEEMLVNNGLYKTFIFTLYPSDYVDMAASGIDAIGLLKKLKKNSELVPIALILTE